MRVLLVLASLVAGCTLGAGPIAGVRLGDKRGQHRFFAGAEVAGGIGFVQASAGLQGPGVVYGRLDLALNPVGFGPEEATKAAGFRFGVGYGGGSGTHGGVLAIGGNYGVAINPDRSCSTSTSVAVVGTELRYVGGWQLVLAPRYESHTNICIH